MIPRLSWFLALLALLAGTARADVLPPDSKFVERCARIENTADFPGVVLAAVVDRVDRTRVVSPAAPDQCLTKLYKFNRLRIFAVPREVADREGLEGLDYGKDPRLALLAPDIDPAGFFVRRSDPLRAVEEVYRLLGFSPEGAVVYKAQETRRFGDGRADETARFPAPSVPGLSPVLARP